MRRSLTISHLSDLMAINLLGKEPTVMRSLCQIMAQYACRFKVRKKSRKALREKQLITWNYAYLQ